MHSDMEEDLGLHTTTKIWECIREDQYKSLCPIIVNALPAMVVATMNKDDAS